MPRNLAKKNQLLPQNSPFVPFTSPFEQFLMPIFVGKGVKPVLTLILLLIIEITVRSCHNYYPCFVRTFYSRLFC